MRTVTLIKVENLKSGDQFRLPGKRKWLEVLSVREITAANHFLHPKPGEFLIVLSNCRQMVVKSIDVELQTEM